jgi:hypothetical protein
MFDMYRLMDIILGILIFCIMIFIIKKQGLLEKYIDASPSVNGENKCSGSHSRDSSDSTAHYHGICPCPSGQEADSTTNQCKDCDAGTAGTGGSCTPCTVNQYQGLEGQTSCNTCASGQIPNGNRQSCVCNGDRSKGTWESIPSGCRSTYDEAASFCAPGTKPYANEGYGRCLNEDNAKWVCEKTTDWRENGSFRSGPTISTSSVGDFEGACQSPCSSIGGQDQCNDNSTWCEWRTVGVDGITAKYGCRGK